MGLCDAATLRHPYDNRPRPARNAYVPLTNPTTRLHHHPGRVSRRFVAGISRPGYPPRACWRPSHLEVVPFARGSGEIMMLNMRATEVGVMTAAGEGFAGGLSRGRVRSWSDA